MVVQFHWRTDSIASHLLILTECDSCLFVFIVDSFVLTFSDISIQNHSANCLSDANGGRIQRLES